MQKVTKPLDKEHVNKEYSYKIYKRHINTKYKYHTTLLIMHTKLSNLPQIPNPTFITEVEQIK